MTHPLPRRALAWAVLTVSDTRTPATDASGDAVAAALAEAGHRVAARGLVPDDAARIRAWVEEALGRADVDAVLVAGGTGVAPRDVTPEAVLPLLEKRLPGFGEAFRRRSEAAVGPAGLLSRAEAGVARGRPVFLVPGSPSGARDAAALAVALAPHARELAA